MPRIHLAVHCADADHDLGQLAVVAVLVRQARGLLDGVTRSDHGRSPATQGLRHTVSFAGVLGLTAARVNGTRDTAVLRLSRGSTSVQYISLDCCHLKNMLELQQPTECVRFIARSPAVRCCRACACRCLLIDSPRFTSCAWDMLAARAT